MLDEGLSQTQVFYDQAIQVLTTYGLSVLGALVILGLGFWASGVFKRLTEKALRKAKKIDETIVLFAGSMIKYLVIIFTLLAVLDQFGVETTSIIALLGAAGLAVGFALQGTLSNLAAGVMLLAFRPFKVGQFVEVGGISGSVENISLFTTHMNTPDNVHIVVPNGNIWGSAIKNYSHNRHRRINLVIGIGYGDDIDKAIAVVQKVIKAEGGALDEPAPLVVVGDLGASSVDLIVRVWSRNADFWAVRWALIKAIKEAFDKEGIEIPYPQTVVHKG